ncbi:MAG: DNA polymerase III subunit delta [Oscillospiraceae bacterium]|nr:DNA polymerase III subunit delta [Oscillospiraceae bacterium]
MAGYSKKKDKEKENMLPQLKADLKAKEPRNLYLFYGEEAYLRNYYLEELRKLLIDGPAEAFNYHRFNNENFTIQAFRDAVEAFPMMAEHTMVQIDDYDLYKAPEDEREQFIEIFSDLPDYCCIVFTFISPDYKPNGQVRRLHNALTKYGLIVEFRRQELRELTNWVRRHFARNNKAIDDRLCQYLIQITGGTMTALASEIQKICTYSESTEILKSDIDAVVEPVLEALVYNITDAILARDGRQALQKVRTLLQMQEDPIKILAGIGDAIRKLRCAKVLIAGKQGFETMKSLYPTTPDYPLRKALNTAGSVSDYYCDRAVVLCAEADFQMKNSRGDNAEILELLVMQLSMEVQHG